VLIMELPTCSHSVSYVPNGVGENLIVTETRVRILWRRQVNFVDV